MWKHAMIEESSNEWVKINNKIGPGAEGKGRQDNEGCPCVWTVMPLSLWVGVLVWIGGPCAVIAAWNVSLVRGCASTTGCHCLCAVQWQSCGVTNYNLVHDFLLANLVPMSPWEEHLAQKDIWLTALTSLNVQQQCLAWVLSIFYVVYMHSIDWMCVCLWKVHVWWVAECSKH